MNLPEETLSRLGELSAVPICAVHGAELLRYPSASAPPLVLKNDPEFVQDLIRKAAALQDSCPLIWKDRFEISFGCILIPDGAVIIGPVSMNQVSEPQLSLFSASHGVREKEPVSVLSDTRLYALTELVYNAVSGKDISREYLLECNGIGNRFRTNLDQEKFLFENRQENSERAHHTYQQEKDIISAIQHGNGKDAIALSMKMDSQIGDMSADAMANRRKLVVSAITVATRAAIDAGVSVPDAYRISDWNLRKMDECRSISDLMECRNHAVWELSELVRTHLLALTKSGYSNRVKNYIAQHYREKIHVEDIAGSLGISPSYLSRVFSGETGVTIQEYITRVRVEKASNLLKYSDASVTQIGEYVHFSSTGYFCQVFKKETGMLPLAFRARYKPSEFIV